MQCRDKRAVTPQRNYAALALERLIAHKFAARIDRAAGAQIDAEFTGRAGAIALQLHLTLVAGQIDLEIALAGNVGRQVRRETVGIVQQKQQRARDDLAAGLRHAGFELRHARFQGLGEAFFFGPQHARDLLGALRQLGVGSAHDPRQHRHQLVEKRPRLTEFVAVAHGAAHDAAQHIAAAFVRGHDAVADQKAAGADVIGDYAQ